MREVPPSVKWLGSGHASPSLTRFSIITNEKRTPFLSESEHMLWRLIPEFHEGVQDLRRWFNGPVLAVLAVLEGIIF